MRSAAADSSCYALMAKAGFRNGEKPARALNPGDVVVIPAGVKHWHGAAAARWVNQLAVEVPGEETHNEWLEAVTDDVYGSLPQDEENA